MFSRGGRAQSRFVPKREFIPVNQPADMEDEFDDDDIDGDGLLKLDDVNELKVNQYPGMKLLEKIQKQKKKKIKTDRLARLMSNLIIQEF
jgi:hypothetical protein